MTEFEAIQAYLQRASRWHDGFEPMVLELLELSAARTSALQRAETNPVVAGSKGQEHENLAWATVLKLQAAIDRLSAGLLLTPRSRAEQGFGCQRAMTLSMS